MDIYALFAPLQFSGATAASDKLLMKKDGKRGRNRDRRRMVEQKPKL